MNALTKNLLCVVAASTLSLSPVQSQTLYDNAIIFTMESVDVEPVTGYLLVGESGLVVEVGEGEYEGDLSLEVVDLSGKMVMPGFVSGHNHLWQSAFRGLAFDEVLYPWLEALHWTYGKDFVDGDFYWYTLHGAVDQLSHGITTTYNHSQRLGGTEAQYLESLQAEIDLAQHFVFSYNGDHRDSSKNYETLFRDFMDLAEEEMAKPETYMLAPSMHSVGLHTSEEALVLEMELADEFDLVSQFHYLEQYSRRESDRSEWPILVDADAIRPGSIFAHFIHTTDGILEESAANGVAMIWNPLSNGRLASGLADIPTYLETGVGVGMGVDGAASADIADPFENMRMGLYGLRMQYKDAKIMSAKKIMYLHTLATAEVIGVSDKVGSLEPGKLADFLVLDPSNPGTGGLFDDPAAHIVGTMNSANIESIYVAGEKQVERGQVIGQDMQKIQAEVEDRIAALRARMDAK